MKLLKDNSIRYNLIRIIILAAGAALIISILSISTYSFIYYRNSIAHNLTVQAKMIGINSTASILFNNQKDAEETLSALKAVPNIVYAAIYTRDGRKFATYSPVKEEARDGYDEFLPQKEGYQFGINHLSLVQPVIMDNEAIGTIYIISNLRALHVYMALHVAIIIAIVTVSIYIATLLLSRLQRKIANPIVKLVELMKGVSENKDYSIRTAIEGPSEIQYLASGFNNMLEQIYRRDMELELQRQGLEKMVEARTAELARSNEQLGEELAERKRAEAQLISAKARLQHLLISSPAVIYSCKEDAGLPFTFVSNNVKDQLGYEPADFLNDPKFWSSHVHIDDIDQATAGINRLLKRGHHINEYRLRHKDGSYLWIRDEMRLIIDDTGEPVEIVGYWIDITERKNAEDQLSHRAFYDQLTGLPNRSLFVDRLRISFEHKKRDKSYLFAVMFMDVDRFKLVNDSLGHLEGDRLLIIVGQRLKNSVRAFDTVARLGGDEFAILFDNIRDISDTESVIDRIYNEMKAPFILSGREVFATISMGIALSNTNDYAQTEDILRDADTAMYYAKASSKSRYVLFDMSMHTRAVAALQMETDLRMAIERKEFALFYQPIVTVTGSAVIGFEALLRWKRSDRMILPNEFITIAEETGLIVPIGQWVLHEACRQMRQWQEKYPNFKHLTISVNLSTKEFSQPNFVQYIERVLHETGLWSGSLKLEITERMIIENYEHASTVFQQLRDLNVQIQIDDFGTGYSALNYMLYLPINALKIDRSFVRRITGDEDVKEVVRTVIALAHTMKMDVIVEGIEKEDELSLFREMKSEYAQGFLFSKPLESKAMEAFLNTRDILTENLSNQII